MPNDKGEYILWMAHARYGVFARTIYEWYPELLGTVLYINSIQRIVYTVCALLCFVMDWFWWMLSISWWRHQMETFSALLALCAGNSLVTGEFQRPVTRGFDVFFWSAPAWINGWVNNREAGDLRRHRAHYDVILMDSRLLHWHWGNHMPVLISRTKYYSYEILMTS